MDPFDGVLRLHGGNRRPVGPRPRNHSIDQIACDERARRVVHQHDLGVGTDDRQTQADGILVVALPATATDRAAR